MKEDVKNVRFILFVVIAQKSSWLPQKRKNFFNYKKLIILKQDKIHIISKFHKPKQLSPNQNI